MAPSLTGVALTDPPTFEPRPGPPVLGPLLALLRAHTADLHRALDARLRLDGAEAALPTLVAFLRTASAVVLPLEVPLGIRLGGVFVHDHVGERRERLQDDLARLGTTLASPWPALPAIATTGDAFGAAYVVLGSHLGGEVIARRLFGRDAAGAPTTYLRLYGATVGTMWTRFLKALERFDAGADAPTRLRAAAVAVALFTAFDLALDREGVPR